MALALFAATVVAFAAARAVEAYRNLPAASQIITVTVILLVLYLSIFKVAEGFHWGGGILMPLGISYYTFKLISYVVDVYWGTAAAEKNFVNFAAYVAFFPQIVAGPIQRPTDFLAQMHKAALPDRNMLLNGVGRILLGIFKKLAAADMLARLVDYGFTHAAGSPGLPRLMAFYIFPIQLFADFSALTDLGIGMGRLFGIESPENFNAPYSAVNISAFWRRWHMTLTNWMRDYVFTPLRMRWRNLGNFGLAASLTVNMVLIALWHGLTLPFLLFGLIHSIYLIVDALTASTRKRYYRTHQRVDAVTNWIGPIFTYHLVCIADLFFRAPSLGQAFNMLARLYSGVSVGLTTAISSIENPAWAGLASYALVEIFEYLRRRAPEQYIAVAPRWVQWSIVSCATVVALFFGAILLTHQSAVEPFVYAIF